MKKRDKEIQSKIQRRGKVSTLSGLKKKGEGEGKNVLPTTPKLCYNKIYEI